MSVHYCRWQKKLLVEENKRNIVLVTYELPDNDSAKHPAAIKIFYAVHCYENVFSDP